MVLVSGAFSNAWSENVVTFLLSMSQWSVEWWRAVEKNKRSLAAEFIPQGTANALVSVRSARGEMKSFTLLFFLLSSVNVLPDPGCENSRPKLIIMWWVMPSSGSTISLFWRPAHSNPVCFFQSKKNYHLNQVGMVISHIMQGNIPEMWTFVFHIMFPCLLLMKVVIEQPQKAGSNGSVTDESCDDEWNVCFTAGCRHRSHISEREGWTCTRIINANLKLSSNSAFYIWCPARTSQFEHEDFCSFSITHCGKK